MSIREVPRLIGDLYKTTRELESYFARPFTPDGHLVGSIGEVIAAYIYDLKLEDCSTPQVDAKTRDGRTVQIKLTGRTSYGFRWSQSLKTESAELLIALQMQKGMLIREVYNGLFPRNLLEGRKDSTNGQLSITVHTLLPLNKQLLPEANSLTEFNRLFAMEAQPLG